MRKTGLQHTATPGALPLRLGGARDLSVPAVGDGGRGGSPLPHSAHRSSEAAEAVAVLPQAVAEVSEIQIAGEDSGLGSAHLPPLQQPQSASDAASGMVEDPIGATAEEEEEEGGSWIETADEQQFLQGLEEDSELKANGSWNTETASDRTSDHSGPRPVEDSSPPLPPSENVRQRSPSISSQNSKGEAMEENEDDWLDDDVFQLSDFDEEVLDDEGNEDENSLETDECSF